MVQDKPLRTSWQQKMKDRQERKQTKDFARHLQEEKERRRQVRGRPGRGGGDSVKSRSPAWGPRGRVGKAYRWEASSGCCWHQQHISEVGGLRVRPALPHAHPRATGALLEVHAQPL